MSVATTVAQLRILVVSAHFPPDFVSGGTIAPDRLARGLAARGHEVSVYAGHLDDRRPPLSTWTSDEDGLSVRWISTWPWTAWTDMHNFDNPAVTSDFAAHLAEVRPDVVHLHSIQTLGAGLLSAAKAAGAATVVTMHDFWWCCARQFLVDQEWSPCSLVVDAGVCPCAAGRPALDQRNGVLRERLRDADLVLAVSAITAEVLAANGVPADRLAVDENGLPDEGLALSSPPPAQDRRGPADPIRFLYAGGPNPMKGATILLEATRLLAGQPGWRLDAYGTEDLAHGAWRGAPAEVAMLPPFAPEALDAVLGSADVVVIPSLRETHSLLTREALLRGATVICTDCLGPEEVVEHGRNGLIVPTGDASALAAAMRQLIDDPDELSRLRHGSGTVRVRSISDQLDGLEAHYSSLAANPARASGRTGATIDRVLFVCGIDGAPLRYRAHLPAEALALRGISSHVVTYRDPSLPDLLAEANAVVVYRAPASIQLLQHLDELRRSRPTVPLLFDVDDLIFDPDLLAEVPALAALPPDQLALYLQGVQRYRTTMEACDLYVGSTAMLCDHATAVTRLPSRRFANGVGLVLGRLSDAALRVDRSPGPVRIGYLSGTTTHDRDWAEAEGAVLEALERHPGAELWLGGHLNASAAVDVLGERVRRIPLMDWRELPGVLRDLDVNLAPLEPRGRFNEAKSAIKWLEAALTATPTIATPTEPFREAIEHGISGYLATTHEEWVASLDLLIGDEAARARVGRRARRDALLQWSPHRQADRYLEILRTAQVAVADGRVERPHSGFVAVALDEPPLAGQVQPYHLDGAPAPPPVSVPPDGRRIRGALDARAATWRRVWRTEGAGAALRGGARTVARDGRRVLGPLRRRLR